MELIQEKGTLGYSNLHTDHGIEIQQNPGCSMQIVELKQEKDILGYSSFHTDHGIEIQQKGIL